MGLGGSRGPEKRARSLHNGAPVAAPRRTMGFPPSGGPTVGCARRGGPALQLPLQNKALQICPLDSKSS